MKVNVLRIGAAVVAMAAGAARAGGSAAKNEAWLLQTNLLEKGSARVDRLPNVLILGDSISLGYTPAVKRKLAGRANVSRPGCNAYNELAADVCKELGVAVDDLYTVAERHLDCQTDGCHFNAKGYDFLAEAVAESVLPRR